MPYAKQHYVVERRPHCGQDREAGEADDRRSDNVVKSNPVFKEYSDQ